MEERGQGERGQVCHVVVSGAALSPDSAGNGEVAKKQT
jgi:hypothetical protein